MLRLVLQRQGAVDLDHGAVLRHERRIQSQRLAGCSRGAGRAQVHGHPESGMDALLSALKVVLRVWMTPAAGRCPRQVTYNASSTCQ